MSCRSLLTCKFYAEKSPDSLMGCSFLYDSWFSLVAFRFSLTFAILIMISLGVVVVWDPLFFLTWRSVSILRFVKFQAIIS